MNRSSWFPFQEGGVWNDEACCRNKSRPHFEQQSGVSPHLFILGFCGISEVSKLESNENLRLTLDSMQMPTVEYKEINMDDYILSLKILKPAGFMDTSHYPLLLLVDGTPGGQTVSERFVLDWALVLVSSFGAIVVRCDGRGSGFQGTNVLHRIHKKLGVFEEQDQKDALNLILKEPYVDQTRVGAFGQVYGGYVTSLLLSGEESPIKCGAVLSPITDFELYATVPQSAQVQRQGDEPDAQYPAINPAIQLIGIVA
ncbi:hypothetical protein ILYODFUR_032592 [Ilyodon furcidens]|uniref:Peptidase S9 prolyl oligopeptidase catalytic domain-containing protein n=1 Tax=Ilyodon furcidens TaxID=33524 RepID=A0ABV0V820_9TELE